MVEYICESLEDLRTKNSCSSSGFQREEEEEAMRRIHTDACELSLWTCKKRIQRACMMLELKKKNQPRRGEENTTSWPNIFPIFLFMTEPEWKTRLKKVRED